MSTGDTTGSWWEHRWAFVLLPVDGEPVMRRFPGHPADVKALTEAIRADVPNLSTQALGGGRGIRLWFMDDFTYSGAARNPLADKVITALGYQHPHGWSGPVALSHETEGEGGLPLPVEPETSALVAEMAAQLRAESL